MNLIITCARNLEYEAREEISRVLEKLGDSSPKISISDMSGILTGQTQLDPVQVVKSIRKMIIEEPWSIRYSLRIIPIYTETQTRMEKIEEIMPKIISKLDPKNTYKISIEKRNSEISTRGIIANIAKKIPNKVSLENPEKILLIQILGRKTGISLLNPDEILSTEKTKRSLSE